MPAWVSLQPALTLEKRAPDDPPRSAALPSPDDRAVGGSVLVEFPGRARSRLISILESEGTQRLLDGLSAFLSRLDLKMPPSS
jgi:hypothetical protein